MGLCCCVLAGTSACKNCGNRYTGGENYYSVTYNEYSGVIRAPYNYKTTEQELYEIKLAIKRLNERIDELISEKNETN